MEKIPYGRFVPKELKANLKFRRKILEQAAANPRFADELWNACARDVLFYVNTFAWTYDARLPRKQKVIPFITYPYQDHLFLEALDGVEKGYDLAFPKSRDMGVSVTLSTLDEWLWHFHGWQSHLLMSRTQDYVDKTDDPKTLMWKIDFIHKHLPAFLVPAITRSNLHIRNEDNDSSIDGESTTVNIGRGSHPTTILLDEFSSCDNGYAVLAATADATKCRLFNSTPQGTANAFYDVVQNPNIKKFYVHWSAHPVKAAGLYYGTPEKLTILDKDYYEKIGKPIAYPFIKDGELRSPWYDAECKRRMSLVEIAQELDIDFLGSGYQFFDADILLRHRKEYVRPPYVIGAMLPDSANPEKYVFTETTRGDMLLWCSLDAKKSVPKDRNYVIGIDISVGTGTSNSCATVGDEKTGEVVAEFTTKNMDPISFAKAVMSVGEMFKGENGLPAYLKWEANGGPGRSFGMTVTGANYPNFYYYESEETGAQTKKPGWYSTRDNKWSLLAEYRRALGAGEIINRSLESMKECEQYIVVESGTVAHAKAATSTDPTASKENHGDRVIAAALCWSAMKKRKTPEMAMAVEYLPGSFGYRREQSRKEKNEAQADRLPDYW